MSADLDRELREKLAAIEHERWSHWQAWFFSQCEQMMTGADKIGLKVPQGYVDHLQKQIDTHYQQLSEQEKESDREQVDRYWPLIEKHMEALKQELKQSLEAELFTVADKYTYMYKLSLEQKSDLVKLHKKAINQVFGEDK
jgi:glutathione S-transferase